MRILLTGIQGSGKGTLAKMLEERSGITHLCSGDIMREEYNKKTRLGVEAFNYWGNGEYVPDHIVLQMIKKHAHHERNAAFDGFPRTVGQANALEKSGIILDHIILLEITEQLALERCLGRITCTNCNAIYGINVRPQKEGICDECSTSLKQRIDDTQEKIRKRFKQHNELTPPLIEFYRPKCFVHSIDASHSPEEVYHQVLQALHRTK